ncbi:MAG: hypothetical protein ACLFWG_03905, partial [Longimicrobiales bacterium]
MSRGRRLTVIGLLLAPLSAGVLSGCNYSFRAGGGFPDYIRTVAVLPFENETNRFELSDNLYQELKTQLPPALG